MSGPVVVFDAAGSIGRAVVQAAIDARRPVIAVSPDLAPLKQLRSCCGGADLTLIRGSIADDRSSTALAAELRKLDRPLAGIVIATCREPARGRVLEQSGDVLRRTFNDEVLPQLAAARALVPVLAEAGRNGGYVVIGGPGSEQPWAGYGHRSIAAASTRMLLRVLHDEARALAVRVQLLAVEMPARTDANSEHACVQWPSAIDIGERALELIDQADTNEPAAAVVRYAWNAIPPLPAPRMASARRTSRELRSTAVQSASAPSDAFHDITTNDSSPLRDLDDTWALIKPLLSMNNQKASTP